LVKRTPAGGKSTTSATRWTNINRRAGRLTRKATAVRAFWANGEPKIGAHGKPVIFPSTQKTFNGALVELEQV